MNRTIDKHEMLTMRLEGMTYKQIAEASGISRQRVQQLLSPPKAIRDIVVKRADGKCQSCGLLIGKSGHIHHEGEGETEDYDDIENLRLLCISCHRKKHLWQRSDDGTVIHYRSKQ